MGVGPMFKTILNTAYSVLIETVLYICAICVVMGAVGAAIGMIPKMVQNGLAGPNEIAVFTAMGMAWSGYLSTHISMMDSLG